MTYKKKAMLSQGVTGTSNAVKLPPPGRGGKRISNTPAVSIDHRQKRPEIHRSTLHPEQGKEEKSTLMRSDGKRKENKRACCRAAVVRGRCAAPRPQSFRCGSPGCRGRRRSPPHRRPGASHSLGAAKTETVTSVYRGYWIIITIASTEAVESSMHTY